MAYAPTVNQAAHSGAVETLARIGYATKGLVYLLIGGLATMFAFGEGGRLTTPEGAVQTIGRQPFGQFLLWATAFGLAAYALWRFIQAAIDPDTNKGGAKRALTRVGYAISGVVYALLAVLAYQLANGQGGGGEGQETWVAKALASPGGTALVSLAGLALFVVAFHNAKRGYQASFMKELKLQEMSPTERTWSQRAGRLGLMSRAVVFGIMGYFLLRAAASHRSSETKDVAEALATIASKPYGQILLAIVAVGLLAYAVHQFFTAKYRRIPAGV